jgi:hypothetical protein
MNKVAYIRGYMEKVAEDMVGYYSGLRDRSSGKVRDKFTGLYNTALTNRVNVNNAALKIADVLIPEAADIRPATLKTRYNEVTNMRKLLIGTSSVESKYNMHPNSKDNYYRLTPIALEEIHRQALLPKNKQLMSTIKSKLGYDLTKPITSDDLKKDLNLATLAAGLTYQFNSRGKPLVIDNRENRSDTWKNLYNTDAGDGLPNKRDKKGNIIEKGSYLRDTDPYYSAINNNVVNNIA